MQMTEELPAEVTQLFKNADQALFELQRALDMCLEGTPGQENWRSMLRMRIQLGQIDLPMAVRAWKNGYANQLARGDQEPQNAPNRNGWLNAGSASIARPR